MSRRQSLLRSDEIDPESRNRFLLIAGMVAIVVFALGLISVGYYVDRVRPRGDTVITVGDREFSFAYFEDRVDAAFRDGRFSLQDPALAIATLVSDIQNEELTRLIAAEQGLTVTTEEIEARMKEELSLNPEVSRNTFALVLRDRLRELDLSLDRYEEIIEAQVLETKLTNQYAADVPLELEQAELSVILAPTDAAAVAARQRIVDGEDFGEVATEVSQHESASIGGALGWTPRDLLQDELGEAAFSVEPGSLSEIIEAGSGFYIIEVGGKETREVTTEQIVNLARTYFEQRLDEADAVYQPQNLLTVGQAQEIIGSLGG